MSNSLYAINLETIEGNNKSLADYQGKVLLIVNVASHCGYTSQYQELEKLYQNYQNQGLSILAFPCNDYGAQEPNNNSEIKKFAQTKYGVTFDLFSKIPILRQPHPLYAYLTTNSNPPGEVFWNFEKFLISKNGEIVARFKSNIAPNAPELIAAIEAQL